METDFQDSEGQTGFVATPNCILNDLLVPELLRTEIVTDSGGCCSRAIKSATCN
jgi:hypothetical protein